MNKKEEVIQGCGLNNQELAVSNHLAIYEVINSGFFTGSVTFGLSTLEVSDIDVVVKRHLHFNNDFGELIGLGCRYVHGADSVGGVDKFEHYCGIDVENYDFQSCYYLDETGVLYNILIVDELLYEAWEYATDKMKVNIEFKEGFKETVSVKDKRVFFFETYKMDCIKKQCKN